MPHMLKRESGVVALLLVLVLFASSSLGAVAGAPRLDAPPLPASTPSGIADDGPRVVRAYYHDREMLNGVASWLDPWEVHAPSSSGAGEGYFVADVDAAGYARLLSMGFRLEVDQELTARLNTPNVMLPGQTMGIPGYPCYRTVEETYLTAMDLASNHHTLATWLDVGDSWEKTIPGGLPGYEMGVLRITNASVPGPKPKLFVMAAIHAREYTTAELVTRFAEYLLDNYGVDPDVTWLVDYHEIHLMLQSNPDGRKIAETGDMWRKNTDSDDGCSLPGVWGVDLNRNYPFQWGCCGGSSGSPCDELYRGPSAASEPETQAVINYVESEFPDRRNDDLVSPAPDDTMGIFLDIHSYSRLVLWPWGFTGSLPPNSTQLQTLGRKFAYFNNYTPQQSMDLYPTDGTTQDWVYGHLGLAGYCFELGTAFFQDCSSFENTILPDNLEALLYAAKAVRTPYLTPAGPDAFDVSATPAEVIPGVGVHLAATASDTRYKSGSGEPTQNIAAAEYYIDVPPWVTTTLPVAYPMTAVDGAFNEKVEEVEATVDTSGLAAGRHTIFVRSQDVNGNWGIVSAAFLTVVDPQSVPVLEGYVRDAVTGAPLAATVTAGLFVTNTNPLDGFYSMSVMSGTYDISADAPAHVSMTVQDVPILDYQTVQQDFDLEPLYPVYDDDVESGVRGWSAEGGWAITDEDAHSPAHSWTDSPGGNYGKDWNYSLTSQPFDLAGCSNVTLEFWHEYELEPNYDFGYLEYSLNGTTWTRAAQFTGSSSGWSGARWTIPALDGAASARIRFRIKTDHYGIDRDGWHVDDVLLEGSGASCVPNMAPIASFTASSPVQLGEPMAFANHTAGQEPIVYAWDFGDGAGTSTDRDPVYTYASAGSFVVTLFASNTLGTDTVTDTVEVLATCEPITGVELSLVTPGAIVPGQEVALLAEIHPPDADAPYSYTVDYDDGTPAVVQQTTDQTIPLSHTYQSAAAYDVEIAAWNCSMDQADAVTDLLPIVVTQPCTQVQGVALSVVSPEPFYTGDPVSFEAVLAPPDSGMPYNYQVAVDGVAIGSGEGVASPLSFTYTFATTGTHGVDVAVWNCDMSQEDAVTSTLRITVTEPCTQVQSVALSLLSPAPLYAGEPVVFDAALAPADLALPYSYLVEVDSVAVASGTDVMNPLPFTHTFATTGTHDVHVEAWNCEMTAAQAVSDTLLLTVIAPEEPCTKVQTVTLSVLTPDPLYAGDEVSFRLDLAPIDLALPYTYSLRVDGLAVAAGTGDANPLLFTYTFADTGTHVVEAIVANCGMGPGEGVTDTAHVVVHQPTVYYYVYLPIIHRNP